MNSGHIILIIYNLNPSLLKFNLQVLFACVAVASAQLVTYPNGAVAPAKTPEVQAAEAAHFAAHGLPYAYGYNGYAGLYAGAYAYPYAYAYGGLVGHPNGAVVPVDEPAVQQARAEHFAAYGLPVVAPVAALSYAGLVAHPNGAVVPVEPADVQAARAEHLAAGAAA